MTEATARGSAWFVRRSRMTALVLLLSSGMALANSGGETERIASLLAQALISGRAVTARYQEVINRDQSADKGLTPAFFLEEMCREFEKRTGIDLRALEPTSARNRLLLAFLAASRKTFEHAQPLINMQGLGFKGFIPAVYGRETGKHFRDMTGITLKQASDQYRNLANAPDAFETAKIEALRAAGAERTTGSGEYLELEDQRVYRYMQPIYIVQACLKCHGDPSTPEARDIAGRKMEGYRIGDLRGVISVTIPLDREY